MLAERIARFVEDPGSGDFEKLAGEAFAFQYEHIPAYRRLCQARGVTPESLGSWHEIPIVPTVAFKSLELASRPAEVVFRSSGTGGAGRSAHPHGFLDLYRRVIDASFPVFCLAQLAQPPMLSLIPTQRARPDSSLAFMVDHVLERHAAPDSLVAFGPRGVEVAKARSWVAARQRDGRAALILATAFALADWLEALERRNLRFRLATGSAVFETGGFKGRRRHLSRSELAAGVKRCLGIPPQNVVREYGMTELTSQCYTRSLLGGDPELFVPPHWVRVRILDPTTLEKAAPGEIGLVAVLDLANLSSAVHLLTEDLGVAAGDGFRLRGRAAGAELRGCSLVVEELQES